MLIISLFLLSVASITVVVLFKRQFPKEQENIEKGNEVFPILGILAVPVIAMAMYLVLGDPDVPKFLTTGSKNETLPRDTFDPESHLEQINKLLAKNPEDPVLLSQLSRIYMMLGKFDLAIENAKRLVSTSPNDAQALVQLSDALAMKSNGLITDAIVELLKSALRIDNENAVAMTLLGIGYEQRDQTKLAVKYWQNALAALPNDSPLKTRVSEMIKQTKPIISIEKNSQSISVTVNIQLSEILRSSINAGSQLFVMLKSDGMKPPIVASKITVSDFPVQIRLDDKVSMLPGISLGNFDSVYAVARISRSGKPLPQSGDLQGTSTYFNPNEVKDISVIIKEILE